MANADRSAEQFRKMTETPIPKLILSLAAPTILSMLITSIYNLADTFFVGQISTSASGAVGIVSSLMAILQALGFMLGHGSGSIISRSLGSQNTDAATRFASTSFFTALVFGGVITVAGLLTLPDFMMLLGSTETILPHACAYARYILLAAPIMMSSLVMNNILRYELCHDRPGHRRPAEHRTGPVVHLWAGHGHRRCGPCNGPEPDHQLLHPAVHVPAGQNSQPVPDHGSHPQPGGVRHHPDDRYAQLWPSGPEQHWRNAAEHRRPGLWRRCRGRYEHRFPHLHVHYLGGHRHRSGFSAGGRLQLWCPKVPPGAAGLPVHHGNQLLLSLCHSHRLLVQCRDPHPPFP